MDKNLKVGGWDDYDHIIDLIGCFFEDSPYKDLTPFDLSKVMEHVDHYLNAPKTEKIILLSVKNEVPTGILIGVVVEVPFSSTKIATEQAWYVRPEFRNTKTSIELINAFEYWANEVAKTDVISLSSLGNEEQDRVGLYYLRKGYTLSEKCFLKGIR